MVLCDLRFQRLSETNMPHEDAFRSTLDFRFPSASSKYSLTTHLCGDHIGILFTRQADSETGNYEGMDMFYLFDWTTGVCKAVSAVYMRSELISYSSQYDDGRT